MPLELAPAPFPLTPPHIFVIDLIAMLSRDFDPSVCKEGGALRPPALETRAVRLVFNPRNHKVRQMAELMREDVEQAGFIVDDFGGEFDGRVVGVRSRHDRVGRVV